MNFKVYVDVIVRFDAFGNMIPTEITWEDDTHYFIDKVIDVCPSFSQKAGGQGDRYTVKILGQQSYLFFEHNPRSDNTNIGRWFVERKQ